jgi:hypothetical protein
MQYPGRPLERAESHNCAGSCHRTGLGLDPLLERGRRYGIGPYVTLAGCNPPGYLVRDPLLHLYVTHIISKSVSGFACHSGHMAHMSLNSCSVRHIFRAMSCCAVFFPSKESIRGIQDLKRISGHVMPGHTVASDFCYAWLSRESAGLEAQSQGLGIWTATACRTSQLARISKCSIIFWGFS